MQASDSQVCLENCLHTNGCVGFSFKEKSQTCRLKSNIEYFQYSPAELAGQACFRPPSYINMSVSRDDVLVSESPILSMLMTSNSSLDCGMLNSGSNHSGSLNERFRREIFVYCGLLGVRLSYLHWYGEQCRAPSCQMAAGEGLFLRHVSVASSEK